MLEHEITFDLLEAQEVLTKFIDNKANITAIATAATIMAKAIKAGGCIISCGNGGSMSDAMHFAEELTGQYRNTRRAMPAMAISDPAFITCTANDFGFDAIFERYIEAFGKAGDVLLAISTSGNSANILRAVHAAKARGMQVVSLTGKGGGKLTPLADCDICIPHQQYSDRIQEVHIKIIHILIRMIEELTGNK